MMASRLGYHASLDGLRAIAVALVVCLHFHVPGFGGGFVGVDLFFVLSGFLITRLLLDEHAATGTISLRRFYGRRALRLLPALAVLLAVTAPFVSRAWTVAAASYVANWFLALIKLGIGPSAIRGRSPSRSSSTSYGRCSCSRCCARDCHAAQSRVALALAALACCKHAAVHKSRPRHLDADLLDDRHARRRTLYRCAGALLSDRHTGSRRSLRASSRGRGRRIGYVR